MQRLPIVFVEKIERIQQALQSASSIQLPSKLSTSSRSYRKKFSLYDIQKIYKLYLISVVLSYLQICVVRVETVYITSPQIEKQFLLVVSSTYRCLAMQIKIAIKISKNCSF